MIARLEKILAVNMVSTVEIRILILYSLVCGSVCTSSVHKYSIRVAAIRLHFRVNSQVLVLRVRKRDKTHIQDLETEFTRGYTSGEYIAVPLHLTFGELKQVVQNAVRDTYYIMERIVVTEVCGLEGVDDGEVLFGMVESGSELCFRAVGMNFDSELKYEGGADNWTVKCKCGTRDDDGERMVACDICEVWQHTRCIGIDDSNTMPPFYMCGSCCASLAPPRTIQPSFQYDFESPGACYNFGEVVCGGPN